MLPPFTEDGVLPPGDYELTFEELRESHLVDGFDGKTYPNWDRDHRARLVDNLEVLVQQLWQVGIDQVFIDGSFVEEKDHPNDIDGYFQCDIASLASGKLMDDLNLLDPNKIWTWHKVTCKSSPGFPKPMLPMWHRYRVELYPHYGQVCGITDEFGNDLEFPAAFRKTRNTHLRKGIIKIVKGGKQK